MTEVRGGLTPMLEQVRTYMLAHGWTYWGTRADGDEFWQHPVRDYEDDGMVFAPDEDQDPKRGLYLSGMMETFADKEGACKHEVLADILGRPDPATLLARIAELETQLEDANEELKFLRRRATGH